MKQKVKIFKIFYAHVVLLLLLPLHGSRLGLVLLIRARAANLHRRAALEQKISKVVLLE